MLLVHVIIVISFISLFFIYLGLVHFLGILIIFKNIYYKISQKNIVSQRIWDDFYQPGVTVYVAAFNEEKLILKRIKNIIDQNYPPKQLEIIIISDGSTDDTAKNVKDAQKYYPEYKIRLIEFKKNQGKAAAQNIVAKEASYDILLSTDADTIFKKDFINKIVSPFKDPKVGIVGGIAEYRDTGVILSKRFSQYRKFENKIREFEEGLGVLAKTDAFATAYRKEIWEPIDEFEDLDQVIIFFAVSKGYSAVNRKDAVCIETPNSSSNQELKSRSRMTRKALLSFQKRWRLAQIKNYPFFSFIYFSHKIFRYTSPLWLILFLSTLLLEIFYFHFMYQFILLLLFLLTTMLFGYLFSIAAITSKCQTFFSFIVSNVGFVYGIVGWLTGDKVGKYLPSRKL